MRKIMLAVMASASCATTITNPPDIFLWDLHDVIIQCSGTLRAFWNYAHKKALVSHTGLALLKKLMPLLAKNLYYEASVEEYICLANKHDNPYLAELIIYMCNAQKEIPGTVAIIDELHSLGYEQHIGSNIGATPFKQLTDPAIHPNFKKIFTRFNLKKSKVIDARNITKPNPQFYREYLRKNRINPRKQRVVFIDDRHENVKSALKLGFNAILFENPGQLRKELQELKIPLSQLPTDQSENPNAWEFMDG